LEKGGEQHMGGVLSNLDSKQYAVIAENRNRLNAMEEKSFDENGRYYIGWNMQIEKQEHAPVGGPILGTLWTSDSLYCASFKPFTMLKWLLN
jgi:hypothetical protein